MNTILSLPSLLTLKHCLAFKPSKSIFKIVTSLFGVTALALTVFCISQLSSAQQAGFTLKSYEQRLNEVSQENVALELELSKTNSLSSAEETVKGLNYEEAGRITYVRVLDTQVAARR